MNAYSVTFASGGGTVVKANNEWDARRVAMVERYGDKPTAVIPHAPDYKGYGLSVREVAA